MHEVVSLQPTGLYDDGSLYLLLGLSATALARGRRSGALKHTRQGKRVLYLGRWILDWLERDAARTPQGVADAR